MTATRPPALTRLREEVFYGWWMVASGFVLMLLTTGIGFYGFTAFFRPIVKEFGWSQAITSGAISLRNAESGLLSPLMGYLADRVGPRLILVGGFFLEGLGLILLSQVHNLWQFYGAFAILALGTGGGSFIVISTAINNWFVRLRGRALSFMFLGPAFAGLIVAGLVWLVETQGWRFALVVSGLAFWLLCIPLSLVMRKRPEAYGLLPDGDRPTAAGGPSTASGPRGPVRDVQMTTRRVLTSRGYWQYVLVLTLQGASFTSLVLYHIPVLTSFGLSPGEAALVVTLWTLTSIPGRLGAGFLADLIDKRLVLAGSLALQLLGAILFLTATDLWSGVAYATVYGIGWGSLTPSRLSLQSEYWGRAIFGRLMGLQMTFGAALGIAAPIFVGRMFDVHGDYHVAFLVLFSLLIPSILLALTIKRPSAEVSA